MSRADMEFHQTLLLADEDEDARQWCDEHIARESELIRTGRVIVRQRSVEYAGEPA